MVNINLSTNQSMPQDSQRTAAAKSGVAVVEMILLIVAVISGGLMLWVNNLDNKVVAVEASYADKEAGLMANVRNKDIVDFQNRLSLSDELVDQKNLTFDVLQEVERNLVSGVYITAFEADKEAKTLKLECVADNYEAVARQVLGFKSSNYFSEVVVKSANISNEGKAVFSMEIGLN
ncbi:MAG: PilN domain-containing protein [Candidatus Moranbacteria bacterium]|nr:PilN domain-containing protein [bacterium]MDP1834002.1 PilN domain-containing protein [Candidatus Moranbacteria bacterium]MDZ4385144.1 PilN domain-containing protein [Candidatus Moranbacteria bacterium]